MRETDENILDEIGEFYIDCPECTYSDDDGYQCGTCGCGGGNGRIHVLSWIKENIKKLEQ